jgi:hypothetical protein
VSDTVTLTDGLTQAYAGFDPAVHATHPDGTPRLKKGGGYAMKRGRKAGAQVSGVSGPSVSGAVGVSVPANPQMPIDQQARLVCGMVEGAFCQVFGDEWETDEREAKALLKATQDYLQATGGMDLSPGTGLLFAWGQYGLVRVRKPKTSEKLAEIGAWFKARFTRAK